MGLSRYILLAVSTIAAIAFAQPDNSGQATPGVSGTGTAGCYCSLEKQHDTG
jgi:hypothetical protein